MKRLLPIALLSILLTGCVNQSDYDELEKENAKLKKKIEKLEDEISELEAQKTSQKPQTTQAKPTSNGQGSTSKSRFFTVDDDSDMYENKETGEYLSYSLYTDAQQYPTCLVMYTIPYQDNVDISYYEYKAVWLVAEMDVYFENAGFESFTIFISTPQGIDRDIQAFRLCGLEFSMTGKDRDGKDSNEPDWFVDAYTYLLENGYDDEWLFDCTSNIKTNIDSNTHYH